MVQKHAFYNTKAMLLRGIYQRFSAQKAVFFMQFHYYSDALFLLNRCRLLTFKTLRLHTIDCDFLHEILYLKKRRRYESL